ncbi:hypothetical protein ISCGN_003119 [Ixodes scapularis]
MEAGLDRPAESDGGGDPADGALTTTAFGTKVADDDLLHRVETATVVKSEGPEGLEAASEARPNTPEGSGDDDDGGRSDRGAGESPEQLFPGSRSDLELASSSTSYLESPDCATSALAPLVVKRGPGRPRKDGSSPIQRKKLFGDLWVGRHSFPGRPRVRSRKPGPFHLSMAGCGGGLTPELPSVGYELELDAPQPQTPGSTTPESVYDPQSAGESLLEKQEESPPEWPERLCSVCNLGETSPMGQGRLVRFEPTLGFQPFRRAARLHRSGSLDQDRSPGATLRRGRAHSPRLQSGAAASDMEGYV